MPQTVSYTDWRSLSVNSAGRNAVASVVYSRRGPGALQARGEDLGVIEREHTVDAGRAGLDRHPVGGPGGAPGDRLGQVRREHEVADGDDAHPGVAIGIAEGGQLLQVMAAEVGHARLLCQGARGQLLERLPGAIGAGARRTRRAGPMSPRTAAAHAR